MVEGCRSMVWVAYEPKKKKKRRNGRCVAVFAFYLPVNLVLAQQSTAHKQQRLLNINSESGKRFFLINLMLEWRFTVCIFKHRGQMEKLSLCMGRDIR